MFDRGVYLEAFVGKEFGQLISPGGPEDDPVVSVDPVDQVPPLESDSVVRTWIEAYRLNFR